MAVQLGRLERVDPRLAWQHEAHDFTPWLLENPDRLAEALGIELEFEIAEHPVGGYSLDLIGRDLTHDAVLIVENQLEVTDHSHLGQVLTYAAGTAASTIVWLATAFREEHRQALDWLNENTGEDVHFFGIELQLVRIGGSPLAPLLNVVVQPNDWQKQVRAATQASAVGGRGALYVEFWTQLLERIAQEHPDWTRSRRPQPKNWIETRSLLRSSHISLSFAQNDRLRIELYIDSGDADRNIAIFDYLRERREQFETAYGRQVAWEDLPHRRACRVADYKDDSTIEQQERFAEYVEWFIDAGQRMRRAVAAVGSPP